MKSVDEWTSYPLVLPNSSSIWSQNDEPRYIAKHYLILPSKMTRLHAYLSIHCSIQAPLKNEDETNESIMKGVSLSPIYQVTCWGRDDETRLLLLSLLYLPKDEWRGAKVLYQLYLKLSLLPTTTTHPSSSLRWQRLVSVAHYSVSLVSISYSSESSRWCW